MQSETRSAIGLRERKKAKTRAAIQHEALRLFSVQGYEATTIEQIVEAVDVSPSTFFRYFPSKEDLVVTDNYDPLIVEVIRSQPSDLGPVQAVRRGLNALFDSISRTELTDMRDRMELALSVPELRAATLDQIVQTIRQITDVIAERVGRARDDFAVETLAGAILGVMISAEFHWVEHRETELIVLLDKALNHLEAGLQL